MDPPLQIRLFGTFAVSFGEQAVPESAWRLRKGKSLVKLLALAPDHRVHRERATEWLWPDREPGAAANNFHQALYVARRALEGAGAGAVLPLRDDVLALDPGGGVEVDVDAFEAAAARAHATRDPADYRAALALPVGELLAEDRYEPWATSRRDAIDETHLGLLLEYAELLPEGAGAMEVLERAVVLDPLHEAAHRALMRRFAASGRRQQALAQYHQLRGTLRRDLAADPDPQTARLYQSLLRGETVAADDPPAATEPPRAPRAERAAHNLPIALTSFVGRDRELAELARLLDRSRLVTLTGAGGSGKTRLALETARARVGRVPGGVWLVELAGLSDPGLVPEATAAALGLTLPSQRLDLDELSAEIGDREALLVLDNCEHLVAACAELAGHVLAFCQGLRVLATSREALRVPGEVSWRVPSLALPDTAGTLDPAELAATESVGLFSERAGDVAPGFELDDENAAAVAEICLRLDGMPLALELAAARVGAMSPAQIAERLNDSLAVLTSGNRAALDRQQTLRATIGWSHTLLTDEEAALFRGLAAFAGSFTLEGMEAVTDAAADLLGRLVDKSLVVPDDGGAQRYRYRLLEPVRQYARERIVAAGELDALERRHFEYYLELARTADPETVAAPAPARLDEDHDNLRAALAWALRHESQEALRLAVHMWPMWMAGGHFREGTRWLAAALAAAPAATALRAEALRAVCGLNVRLGRAEALEGLGAERVAIFRELGDRTAEAHALDEAGVYEYMTSRYDRASRLYGESLALARELGDGKVGAAVLHSRAVLAHCRGDLAGAREALLDSLAVLRGLPGGDREPFFRVHTVGFFVAPGRFGGTPRMHFEETLQFFRRVDARLAIGYVLAALGDVARAEGLDDPARERLTESLAHFREEGDAMGTAFVLNRLGNLCSARGEHELGREYLEEALALRRELGDRRGEGMTLVGLGALAARAGDFGRGRALVAEALALFEETDDAPGRMGVHLTLGNIAAAAGERDVARTMLEAGSAMAEEQRLYRCVGWTTVALAELALADGEGDRATELLRTAREHFRRLGDAWGLARCLELGQVRAKWSLSPSREG